MKKISFLLIITAAFFGNSWAQSMLKVRLVDNSQITIALDDRYFNKRGTSVTVGELPFGRHRLRIFANRVNRRGRLTEETLYQGFIKTYDGMITLFVYDPVTGQADARQQDINEYTANHPGVAHGRYGDNNALPNGSYGTPTQPRLPATNHRFSAPTYSQQPAQPPAPTDEPATLTADKINNIKTAVASLPADTKKMDEIKNELNNEKFTTSQVAAIMDNFNFESSKVDFAKWAYTNTVDKENYTDLENKFTYKTSQDDLDKFINENK